MATDNIVLLPPNLITYLRIPVGLLAVWFGYSNYVIASFLFIAQCFMDDLDGIVARRYNQCTKFGAILDLICDLSFNTFWLMMLGNLYPNHRLIFIVLAYISVFTAWLGSYGFHGSMESFNAPWEKYWSGHIFMNKELSVHSEWCTMLMLFITRFTSGPEVPIIGIGLWYLLLCVTFPFYIKHFLVMSGRAFYGAKRMVATEMRERRERSDITTNGSTFRETSSNGNQRS